MANQIPPQRLNVSQWLAANGIALLAGTGAFLGVVGGIFTAVNTSRINNINTVYQSDKDFAGAIHSVAAILSSKTSDPTGMHAMVEYAALYADTESVPHKLVLVEMAQTAGQNQAMIVLSHLAQADDGVQSPRDGDVLPANAIKSDINKTATSAIQSAAPSPSPGAIATGSNGNLVPTADAPLTQSNNLTVRANASLVEALPLNNVSGWIFVGDATGKDRHNNGATLDGWSKTISSETVPGAGAVVTACKDLNIRQAPYENGALGAIVGIAPRGSIVVVDAQTGANKPQHADAISRASPHIPFTAWWIHVTLQKAAAPGGDSQVPATSSSAQQSNPC